VIPFAEARAHVVARCPPLRPVALPLADALGCVLAHAEVAREPVPPFANSAMDGFAVRAADVADAGPDRPVRLRVVADIHAGHTAGVEVGPGCAARIMTGAPLPAGADAVVVVERSTSTPDGAVLLTESVAPGRHVRPAGDDIAPGQEVLAAGTVLTAAHLGVLAALGRRTPTVIPRPTVAVLSTGDELVDHDGPLRAGQIRETNRPTLLAAAAGFGFRPVDVGTVPDDRDQLRAALVDAARSHDAVVTTGGVSMGDVDLVKVVLAELADMAWMQVAIRPAKPFAFGVLDGTPVFGLPGNPVSSLVSLALLGVPGLRARAGRADLDLPRVPVRVTAPVAAHHDGRTAFVRATVRWTGRGFDATPAGRQGSHQLSASASANGLLVLERGVDEGAVVEAVLLRDPFGP
jgi:molybdenum cofactor synthesis domain-containing protein